MIFGDDKYTIYVVAAYAATVLILGGLIWSTIAASRRAQRDLDDAEKDRGR